METRANYALIGAFVLMAAAAVIGFALWLGSSQFNRDYAIYDVVFPGPVSLEEGASVRYIGIKVGEVETVRIDRRDASMVRARLRVDKSTPVKSDSTANIDFAGITGVTFVQINAGSDDAGLLLPAPYEDIAVIEAGETPLTALFNGGAEIVGQAGMTIDQLSNLLTEENITAMGEILANVRDITATLSEDDKALLAQSIETLASLERAGDNLTVASKDITTVASSLDQELISLNADLKALVSELNGATGDASAMLTESRKAVEAATLLVEGGASDTVQQTSLAAQELRLLISRLDRLTRDIEQNPQGLVIGDPLPYEERR
jgi:phospholipid/cholesterol/gamma-HCH transport system substrate-binding protein